MTTLINPIFESQSRLSEISSSHRFWTMFASIQQTQRKQSDVMAYITTPFIDAFILEPAFAIDASIHLINCFASFAKACILWTITQQNTSNLVGTRPQQEFTEAFNHLLKAGNAIIAQTVNSLFSFVSLFTRPIASLVYEVSGNELPINGPSILAQNQQLNLAY